MNYHFIHLLEIVTCRPLLPLYSPGIVLRYDVGPFRILKLVRYEPNIHRDSLVTALYAFGT